MRPGSDEHLKRDFVAGCKCTHFDQSIGDNAFAEWKSQGSKDCGVAMGHALKLEIAGGRTEGSVLLVKYHGGMQGS